MNKDDIWAEGLDRDRANRLDGTPVGTTIVEGNARVVNLKGYDPLRHNLFGVDVLHQDKEWIDADGHRWRIEDMESSHRRNLLRFLRRRAGHLASKDAMIMSCGPMAPCGDMATMACEDATDWMMDHPRAWLETTALVTRLRSIVEAEDAAVAAAGGDWWET